MNYLGFAIGLFAILELILSILLFKRYIKTKSPMTLCTMLISIGLIFDALFIVTGKLYSENMLLAISRLRFIAHGALIPLLIPMCGYGLKASKKAMKVLWSLAAVAMILGVVHAFGMKLKYVEYANLARHTIGRGSPLWAMIISNALSFCTVIPLIICGIIIWKKQKNPHLFLSGLLMFFFAGLGPAIHRMDLVFFFSMFGELFMILFALLYIIKDEKSLMQ